MKHYLIEIALSTIVAVVVTLFFYIVGLDKSWQDAANTFGAAFLLMFVLGLFGKYKQNKKQ